MLHAPPVDVDTKTTAGRRTLIRYSAGVLAGLISLIYFMIGFRLVSVLDDTTDQPAFGITAGIAFLGATVVVFLWDRRILWALGAMAQTFIIYTYFDLASERSPSYEEWGILIRVLQVILLGVLVYLALRPTEPERAPATAGPSSQGQEIP